MAEYIKNKVVISAVNFTSGGPLSVLLDCLSALKKYPKIKEFNITVLVHKKDLVSDFLNDFHFEEFPKIKSSWFKRFYFEYVESKALSAELLPEIWLSLHDMTPNVSARHQYVYCHNPAPFYDITFKETQLDFKFFLFNQFYKYLYRINIKKNKFVIVQQDWLRSEFEKNFGVDTIVAFPAVDAPVPISYKDNPSRGKFTFFYPSFPRIFKNFEVIANAAAILSRTRDDFQVILTIDGTENAYSKSLYSKFSKYPCIQFVGKLDRTQVFENYEVADCMIFPSKLETWGLPITEFKSYKKPILVAELPYAHETVGHYDYVKFFNPNDEQQLTDYMSLMIDGKVVAFDDNKPFKPNYPFFEDWLSLVSFLLENK